MASDDRSHEDWYTVWRRLPDGHVAAAAGRGTREHWGGDGLTLRTAHFTLLLETQHRPAAPARIRAEREAAKYFGDTWYCYEEKPCTQEHPHGNRLCGLKFGDEVSPRG